MSLATKASTGTVDVALVPTVVSVIVVDDAGFVVVSVSRCCRVAEEGGGEEGGQGVGGEDRKPGWPER